MGRAVLVGDAEDELLDAEVERDELDNNEMLPDMLIELEIPLVDVVVDGRTGEEAVAAGTMIPATRLALPPSTNANGVVEFLK